MKSSRRALGLGWFALALATCPGAGRAAPLAAVVKAEAPRATDPEHEAGQLLNLGTHLTDRDEFASAELAYRQILDRPGFTAADQASALFGLAHTYRKAGAATKAAAIYEKFIKEFPGDDRVPDALLELGRTLRSMGAGKMALNQFYAVIDSTLKLSAQGFAHYESLARTAQYEVAETYYETGDYERAGKYFVRLQLLDLSVADRARASFMSAQAQLRGHDLQAGAATLRTFLETWPNDENAPEARYLLATTLRQLNRSDEALALVLDLLRQERRRDAADAKTWVYWQRRTSNLLANQFFQSGDIASAMAIYRSMGNLAAEPAWRLPVLYQLALCYERLGQYDAAATAYRTIVAAPPAPNSPELADLAKSATWRLDHLAWLNSTQSQLSFFHPPTP